MMKRVLFVALLLSFMSLLPLAAQDIVILTEKYATYDSLLTFNYPMGWLVDGESDDFGLGFFVIANTSQAVETLRQNSERDRNSPLDSGEIGIIFMRPRYLTNVFQYGSDTTPRDALIAMFGASDVFDTDDIEDVTIGDYPAARLDAADERSAGIILALDLGDGGINILAASTTPDDLAAFTPTVLAIAESLRFGGDALQLLIHDQPIWTTNWSPDGRLLGTRTTDSSSQESITRLWDIETGEVAQEFEGLGVKWKGDNSQYVIWDATAGTVVRDAATHEALFTLPAATYADWTADDTRLITSAFAASTVLLFDAADGEKLTFVDAKTSFPTLERGGTLVQTREGTSVTGEAVIALWDAASGDNVLTVEDALTITWNADQSRALIVTADNVIHVYELPAANEVLTIPLESTGEFDELFDVRWGADETLIAANVGTCPPSRENCTLSLSLWDAATGELRQRLAMDEPFRFAAWNPEGSRVLTMSRETDRALLWDVASGEQIAVLPHPDHLRGGLWSADGSQYMTWSNENIVRIWDAETNTVAMSLPHDLPVKRAYWNADRTLIETETEDGGLYFWDTRSGRLLLRLGHASKGTTDVFVFQDWSADGRYLATWLGSNPLVRVWDVKALTDVTRMNFASDPFTFTEYVDRGFDAIGARDYATAVTNYTRALQLDPDSATIYNDRGVAYYQLGEGQRGVADLQRAIDLDPLYVKPLENLGDIARREQEFDAALEYYNRALELGDNAVIYNKRGVTYVRQGLYDEAIADFSTAIELVPDFGQAYGNRGFTYYQKGADFYAEALLDLREYARLFGDNAAADLMAILQELEAAAGS
ncbi:MAG: tetratricopeptide repeat protein [Anaerolineae bacterium]|nr:tetratricopeptide repeat protein [Anaerolineae bacterium]